MQHTPIDENSDDVEDGTELVTGTEEGHESETQAADQEEGVKQEGEGPTRCLIVANEMGDGIGDIEA